jgi:manganese-dependent inorganic pyrophosphatase
MDSVCSAWAYAKLQNVLDKQHVYQPVRCGNLNDATKDVFERVGVPAPAFIKDVRCRVSKVMANSSITIDYQQPLHELISIFEKYSISVIPVLKDGVFAGLLSIDEINRYFLREVSVSRPFYHIDIDNLPKVLKGHFIKKGTAGTIKAQIVVGAMSFARFKEYFDTISDDLLPIFVVGDRIEPILEAIVRQVPMIILTKMSDSISRLVDFSAFKGAVFVSDADTSETLRLLRLCIPVGELLENSPAPVDINALFDEAKSALTSSTLRGLPIFEGTEWKGFVTRRCFLEKPRTKVILVDHNEIEQAVNGIEEAEVVGIIDHHRFGAPKMKNPISIYCSPLGSTCTLVTQLYERHGVCIDKQSARILLSGLVSDTVILKSPTTTEEDKRIADVLCKAGEVDDLVAFGQQMFSSSLTLSQREPRAVIDGDFKMYKEGGLRLGIGQCEVTTLRDLEEYRQKYLAVLEEVKKSNGLDWALFLITNVIKENSILLTTGLDTVEYKLAYEKVEDKTYSLPGVLSRKKQLLPEIIRVIEE